MNTDSNPVATLASQRSGRRKTRTAVNAPAKRKPVETVDETEIALALCKECLGWQDAVEYNNNACTHELPNGWDRSLDPHRLPYVLDAVKGWLNLNGTKKTQNAAILNKIIPDAFLKYSYDSLTEHERCTTLMAACVHEARTPKGK